MHEFFPPAPAVKVNCNKNCQFTHGSNSISFKVSKQERNIAKCPMHVTCKEVTL